MIDQNLLRKLSILTGSLSPGEGVSSDDLKEVRQLMARFLVAETDDMPQAPSLEKTQHLTSLATELPDLDKRELEEVISDAKQLHAAVTAGERSTEELEVRVYRRELPIITSQTPSSLPLWAAGRRIDRTIGPFHDTLGRPFWFDIFWPVRQVSVVRQSSTTPFLQIPISGFILKSTTKYKLPAGSIWIHAQTLTPTAPANAYTGLRIKGGELILTTPGTISHGTLQIAATDTVTLKIILDPPSVSSPGTGPGIDAGESEAQPPATATFTFSPTGDLSIKTDDANARIYNNEFRLTRTSTKPEFEPLVNRIMVPYETSPVLTIERAQSLLFQPKGKTEVTGAAWALPVTVATPASLGEATGAGALAVFTKGGLRASWRGLEGPPIRLGTLLMVEPGRLVVVAKESKGPASGQHLQLWVNNSDPTQRSTVELNYNHPFTLRFFSEQNARETLLLEGAMTAALDRPLCSDGSRIPTRSDKAMLSLIHDKSGFSCQLAAYIRTATEPISLALSNALFKTSHPLVFVHYGQLSTTEPNSVESGATVLLFDVHLFVPFLPDPYAANLSIPPSDQTKAPLVDESASGTNGTSTSLPKSTLYAVTLWTKPNNSQLFLSAFGLPNSLPAKNTSPDIPSHDYAQEDQANLEGLRAIFDYTAGGGKEHIKLLDVSTHADQLGVGFGVAPLKGSSANTILQFKDVAWVSAGHNMRVFTTPQIQWEPVITAPNPDGFPSPLASISDGGPTLLGANSVSLVPVAPRPLLSQIVDEFNQETDSVATAALFTLPFGMVASARLEQAVRPTDKGARLTLNQPTTSDGVLKGGLQISLEAVSPNIGPSHESPSFEGATVQTRNGLDPNTLTPLFKSVLSGLPGSAPGTSVEDMFNDEMKPGGSLQRVPVSRIDLSGYGASTFSNWYNPGAAVAETSQVRFDVMVGRTAYEVVQVKSILFPWGVPVVRTITIERRREGLVFRKDSGWVAIAEGRFTYPAPAAHITVSTNWGQPLETHPGVIVAAHEVRNIRETGRSFNKIIEGEDVVLAEVRFDTDFELDPDVELLSGQNTDGRVPSTGQVGFIQTGPSGLPLYDVAFAQLLQEEGPLGGPLDCVINIGKSGQIMRIVRVDVSAAPTGSGSRHEFVAAARGVLDLPNDGNWSVLRHDFSEPEPKAVDLDSGIPLIREGKIGHSTSDWFLFADPEDLLRSSSPGAEYAIMQSSSSHRVLFPRPKIKENEAALQSSERGVLADVYAMASSVGLFPDRSKCFSSLDPYQLDIQDGRYKLNPTTMRFLVTPTQERRELTNSAAFKIYARYPVGDPDQITFTLDPDAPKVWDMHEQNLAIVMDLGPFEALMTVTGDFHIEDDAPPELQKPELIYGPALGPVNGIIQLLSKVSELLGAETPFGLSMSNQVVKMKASVSINVGLLAKKLFGASSVDANGFFALWPNGLQVKGSIEAGMGNEPNILSNTLGLTSSDTGITEFPNWTGYFAVKLGVKVPITLPIFGDGVGEVTIVGNELTSYFADIRLKWGVSLGASGGSVFAISGRFYFGIIFKAGERLFGIGILVGVSGSAKILNGLFVITVKFELIGLIEYNAGRTEAVGQAVIAAEITVCWFITVSFSTKVEVREEISV